MRFGRRGRTERPPVRRTEVSGIPCFWAETPPPFTTTLVFRVGRCDETLPTAGITHLTEHILMPASPPREVDRNARVEDVFAAFWAVGNQTRALRFLEGLAGFVREPPLDRLETERSILRTEGAGGGGDPVSASLALRYGARAHGLMGFEEYGLHTVGPDEIAAWVKRFFTRENAVLWMTGPPPRDFSLDLPQGSRMGPPPPEPLPELAFPLAHPAGPEDSVVAAYAAARSPALTMAHAVLVDRAWQEIRYDRGLAYNVADVFEALSAESVHATLWVDSLTENVDAVRDTLLRLLSAMADAGPTEQELANEVERLREEVSDVSQLPSFLHYSACEHLLGREISGEEYVRARAEVTPQASADAFRSALDNLLLAVPSEEQVPEDSRLYPLHSSGTVSGRAHRASLLRLTKAARRTAMIVGEEGVTITGPDESPFTVRFADIAAVVRWPDGSRSLWGVDGTHLYVDPDTWRGARDAIDAIDEAVSEELVVRYEPELVLRNEALERVTREKLKRRWVVDDELEALARELGEGETLLTLAEACRGLRAGLLAVTDRRVLWLFKLIGEKRLELPYEQIESVSAKRGLLEAVIRIRTNGETIKFSDIVPKARADEIEELVSVRVSRTSAGPG